MDATLEVVPIFYTKRLFNYLGGYIDEI